MLEFVFLDFETSTLTAQKFGYFITLNYLTLIILIPFVLLVQFYGKIFYRKLKKIQIDSESDNQGKSQLSEFQLAIRLPLFLSLLGFTLTFGVFLPLIIFLFAFLIFLIFWIDKIIFFNSSQIFSFESSKNLKVIIFSLPYFMLFSVGVSIFALGNFHQFPTSRSFFVSKFTVNLHFVLISQSILNFYDKFKDNLKFEFEITQFLPLTILFFIVFLYSFGQFFLYKFLKRKYQKCENYDIDEYHFTDDYDFRKFDNVWKAIPLR